MDEHRLISFLESNPEYYDILERAVRFEEQHPNDSRHIGWPYGVELAERQLYKLVYEGIVEASFQSGRLVDYKLTDREMVKKTLGLADH